MMRSARRLAVTAMCTLLLTAGVQTAAEAKAVPRVSGLAVKAPNSCAATMRVTWKGVAGASYQVRWASSKSGLGAAAPVGVRRHALSAGPLAGTTYFQVRAVKHGRAGAWSAVRAGRFGNQRASGQKLGLPTLSGYGLPGAAQFTWGCVPGATRFRVAWSAVPFGKWPQNAYVSGWLPKSARSSTFAVPAVPQSGDHMLGVAYANPVFAQLEAGNARGRVRHSTGWVPVFPAPPDPGAGDALRIGTYNVMGAPAGARATAIAVNINSHGLGVVALQEASNSTAQAIVAALGSDWAAVPYTYSQEQILYRKSVYRVLGSGLFDVFNAKTPGTPLATPWARLALVNGSAGSRPFIVSSGHVTEDAAKSVMDRKADAGREARDMMAGINAVNTAGDPVVLGADLHYLREPFTDVPGYVEAPPTLVRSGYYDAMAAQSKTNIAYSTFNGGNGTSAPRQDPVQSGVCGRADYVMLKGFRGSRAYVNVANWSWNGVVPSDHNLVYADVVVPFQ